MAPDLAGVLADVRPGRGAEGSAEAEALAVRTDVTDRVQTGAAAVAALVVLDGRRKDWLVGVGAGFAHATSRSVLKVGAYVISASYAVWR
ncbi:hypothetical protein Airi01_067410 [Actinoallomurus iriomotensis]|uniref:Uncharacterized protein n=1 Tax=Actinoallomurus iriomotensis TaxID=478107 RepID=A0A9W6VSV0_9ACTN|nr:hypothetical protein Airi01_067410 [Actinoallomurus iriomotensis]